MKNFIPGMMESIEHIVKNKILYYPKVAFMNLLIFIKGNLVFFGWGLLVIGLIFGIILLVLFLSKKPKEEPVPYIQTNQPRAQEPKSEVFSGAILYITQANGYRENVPMCYDRMIIGANPGCQIVLADHKVSDQHAEIYTQEGRYFVRDLGSTNGTFVNGSLIEGIVELFQGSYIQMGDSTIQI